MPLSIALLISAAHPTFAAGVQKTVVIGTNNSGNFFPFSSSYRGEYQQVYTSSALKGIDPGPFTITGLAFKSTYATTETFILTYTLFYTSAAPSTLSTNYATNKGAALQSNSGTFTFTGLNNGTFDCVLPTSFSYNPSQGNLLLDVNVSSGSNSLLTLAFGGSADTGRVYNTTGTSASVTAGANEGLQTQFTATVVPEPSPVTVFALAGVYVSGLLLRAKRLLYQSAPEHPPVHRK